jgi:hypothetical protein
LRMSWDNWIPKNVRQVNMLNKWRVFNGDAEYMVAF